MVVSHATSPWHGYAYLSSGLVLLDARRVHTLLLRVERANGLDIAEDLANLLERFAWIHELIRQFLKVGSTG